MSASPLKPNDRTTSGSPSSNEDDLPTNVHTEEQLHSLPDEVLSGDPDRPLQHFDVVYSYYALDPLRYSVFLILAVELMERFSFYGVYYTQTLYLTGVYNEHWNAGFTSVDAASFVSISTAVAYSTPFLGAILADAKLGDYKTILFGALAFYLPGLLLVALTTVPGLLGEEFNTTALSFGLLFLWPMGSGIVKSCVNVFGARQFHPLLQSSLIESYYVSFYTSINIGALAGVVTLPIIAQKYDVTLAYSIPVVMLATGMLLFVAGTRRYVRGKPTHNLLFANTNNKQKRISNSNNSSTDIPLTTMFRIALLIVPFCVAYSQMPTTFIVQGTVMNKALFGYIDAASINLCDTVSVLVFGYITGGYIYPALQRRRIKIPTTYKFALGSFLGVLSTLWALLVESMIHSAYYNSNHNKQISILWQAPSYILIGFGEIFAVSTAYEVAFTASSPQTKVLASAINIFCIGGLPNGLCIILYQACRGWFRNSTRGDTNISKIQDYATAHVSKYYWVLVAVLVFGVLINLHPKVRDFVESTEKKASDIVKTPLLRMTPQQRRRVLELDAGASPASRESTPLIRKKLFGKRPALYHMGSMREGRPLSFKAPPKMIKAKDILRLYKSKSGAVLPKKGNNNTAPAPPKDDNDVDVEQQQGHILPPANFQHSQSR